MVVTQPVFLVYSIPDLDSPVRPFQETCFLCMDETRLGLMKAHGTRAEMVFTPICMEGWRKLR